MARISQQKNSTGKKILLIDDQVDYLEATSTLLKREGHEVKSVLSGMEGINILKNEHYDLLLVDYYMPGGLNGEEVVKKLREFNTHTQVILQTGYSGEYPPREMLKHLDIQGYYDKTEGPDKLLLWVEVGLKAADRIQLLIKSKLALQYILDVTPELHKIQQIEEIFQGILYQITGLIGIVNTFIATYSSEIINKMNSDADGFIAMMEDNSLSIRASTGKFQTSSLKDNFKNENLKEMHEIILKKKVYIDDKITIVPLILRDEILGLIYLDQNINNLYDIELLQIFANQAAVAIHNAILYNMAILDPLTGVYARRFFDQWIIRELRTAFRSQSNLTLILADMNHLKKINDSVGHLAGDKALSDIGKALKNSTRTTDFVARYGGDEFAIILPQTNVENSKIVTNRIIKNLSDKFVDDNKESMKLSLSIGVCCLKIHNFSSNAIPRPIPQTYFEVMAKVLIKKTDDIMYISKRDKENTQVNFCEEIDWIDFKVD